MAEFWQHKVEATIAGIRISDPKIQFSIKRESDSTPPSGFVSIFNLSVDTERQIHERGKTIILNGGYGNNLGLLFDGAVQKVERERIKLSRITTIKIAGKVVEKETLSGVTNRSYNGDIPVRQIVTDIATDINMKTGPLNLIPADAVIHNWHYTGRASNALTIAIRDHGLTWYEDDGVIRVNKPGRNTQQADAETVSISEENGLIGAPSVTDQGVRIRCLLRPTVRIGHIVNLKSLATTGRFKIVAIHHVGDNWTGSFYSELDLREL